MLYLYLFHTERDDAKLADPEQAQRIVETITSEYRRRFSEDVKVLGGQVVRGPLPAEPDTFVVATCLLACKAGGIKFNTRRDEISYAVDTLNGSPVGTGRIRVKTSAKPWWQFW